ncbi:MAG: PEP-CTERM sorting domain-containing protein [Planctomycetota bacterium]|jgi:hypothetical protein
MKKFCIVVVCALSLAAYADEELGGFGAMWGPDGTGNTGMNMMDPMLQPDGETWMLSEVWDIPNNCLIDFDLTYDMDPYVLGGLSVTNNAGFDQSFMFTFDAPVSPAITTATNYSGGISGSYTVDGTAGSVSTTGMMPLYQARIDGADILSLYDAPQLWDDAAAGESGSILAEEIPYLSATGPAALSDLQIVIRFTLTPGETATLNSNFVVEPVPEPATMTLLGLGALVLGRRKR